jgi:hypothetical protein
MIMYNLFDTCLRKMYILGLFACLVFAGTAYCSSQGTSGAQFLEIVASPRAAAMGSAFTAFCDDANSVEFNPAGLAYLDKREVSLVQNNWVQGVSNQYLTAAVPTSVGVFNLNLVMLSVDGIVRTDDTGSSKGTFGSSNLAAGIAYANSFAYGMFSAGLNIKSLSQTIDNAGAAGIAGDFGFICRCSSSFNIGASLLNAGSGVKFISSADPLPTTVRAGIMYMPVKGFKMGLDANRPNDADADFGAGAEYSIKAGRKFVFPIRTGYRTGKQTGGVSGLAAGCGIIYKGVLEIDFSWVPMSLLGDTTQFGLTCRF